MSIETSEDRLLRLSVEIRDSFTPGEIAKLIRLIEPTPGTGELGSDEFNQLMNALDATSTRRGYSQKSREAARLVMVMGANRSEAAQQSGLSVQAVNQLMQRIRRRMRDLHSE